MKMLKSFALISLATLFALNTAQADTKKKTSKPQTKQVTAKKPAAKKTTTAKQAKNKQVTNKGSTAKKVATAAGVATAGAAVANAKQSAVSQQDALKQFNAAFGIKFERFVVEQESDGTQFLALEYNLTNRSNKSVKMVQYIGAFLYNNQIVYAQEIPLAFDKLFPPQESTNVKMRIPFTEVPEVARKLFLTPNVQINTVNGAQLLVFGDNSKIVVK